VAAVPASGAEVAEAAGVGSGAGTGAGAVATTGPFTCSSVGSRLHATSSTQASATATGRQAREGQEIGVRQRGMALFF
jgi:hypothetical protein